MSDNPLFQPIKLGPLSLPNRIVMAPMTRTFSPGNKTNDLVEAYYARRAENEVGLICVAVPVFNRNNEFIAAISNSGPTARFNESKIQNYTDVLKETANQLKLIFN